MKRVAMALPYARAGTLVTAELLRCHACRPVEDPAVGSRREEEAAGGGRKQMKARTSGATSSAG